VMLPITKRGNRYLRTLLIVNTEVKVHRTAERKYISLKVGGPGEWFLAGGARGG
jgi:hypothetical protein